MQTPTYDQHAARAARTVHTRMGAPATLRIPAAAGAVDTASDTLRRETSGEPREIGVPHALRRRAERPLQPRGQGSRNERVEQVWTVLAEEVRDQQGNRYEPQPGWTLVFRGVSFDVFQVDVEAQGAVYRLTCGAGVGR